MNTRTEYFVPVLTQSWTGAVIMYSLLMVVPLPVMLPITPDVLVIGTV